MISCQSFSQSFWVIICTPNQGLTSNLKLLIIETTKLNLHSDIFTKEQADTATRYDIFQNYLHHLFPELLEDKILHDMTFLTLNGTIGRKFVEIKVHHRY